MWSGKKGSKMDDRLTKIKELLIGSWDQDEEDFCVWEDKEYQAIEIPWYFNIALMGDNVIGVSFYSNVNPLASANLIKLLCDNNIQFDIYENLYPLIERGEFEDMLFGEEADLRYKGELYKELKQKYARRN